MRISSRMIFKKLVLTKIPYASAGRFPLRLSRNSVLLSRKQEDELRAVLIQSARACVLGQKG